ncbi:hypothetical protein GCM10011611_43910 [Aliidongia dinghuensis]|uniref:Uncharacterized protein n=1 Tax=Aliidongia dinghuensis TaxID=1867774 RepID=A0A8J3E557_9PROT|nr:hypothetical protein [Aliidongia dinghuensis]GGF32939.1 hypothetical protein GCM10011611_43910 [Aliidongia dinghuensis]
MAAVPHSITPSVAIAPASLLAQLDKFRRPAASRALSQWHLPRLTPVAADPAESRALAIPAPATRELAAAWLVVFAIAFAGVVLF